MCHYCHLTNKERLIASALSHQGCSISYIAKLFGRSKSTISREFRWNRNSHTLIYEATARISTCRKCRHRKILLSKPVLFLEIKDKFLNHQWSPEQIVGRMKKEGIPPVSAAAPFTEPFVPISLMNRERNAWRRESCATEESKDIQRNMRRNGENSK